jgi:hypothetical protein
VDVSSVLMASAQTFTVLPENWPAGVQNAKVNLRNDILQWPRRNDLGWSPGQAESSLGKNFVQTLTDTLWYIDGNHHAIITHSRGIHICFQQFSGYNVPEKHKKRKRQVESMKQVKILELSESLFSLAACSIMKSKRWLSIMEGVLHLADDSLRK